MFVLAETVNDVEKDLTDDAADDERRLLNVLLYAAKEATGSRRDRAAHRTVQSAAKRGAECTALRHYRRNLPALRSSRSPVPPIMPLM